jgi:hypothetical protein
VPVPHLRGIVASCIAWDRYLGLEQLHDLYELSRTMND